MIWSSVLSCIQVRIYIPVECYTDAGSKKMVKYSAEITLKSIKECKVWERLFDVYTDNKYKMEKTYQKQNILQKLQYCKKNFFHSS